MTPILPAETAHALVDPKAYGEWDGLNEELTRARPETPLAVAENDEFASIWVGAEQAS